MTDNGTPADPGSELERLRRRVRELEARQQGGGSGGPGGPVEVPTQTLLDASTDRALLIDAEGTILALNETAAKAFRKDESELIGTCIYGLFPPELAGSRRALTEEVVCSGEPARWQDQRAGRVLDNSVHPVRDAQGNVAMVAIFARDITEQLQAEEALRESERRYRFLFDAAPVGIGIADQSGKVLAANACMQEMTGLNPGDLGEHSLVASYVDPAQRAGLLETLRQAGQVRDFEARLRRKGGTEYWGLLNIDLIEQEGQELLFTTCRDITRRKRADDELKEQRQLLGDILTHVPHAVFWKDTESVYLGCNARFAEAAGLSAPAEVVGRTDLDLGFDPQDAQGYRADDRQVIETGQPLLQRQERLHVARGEARSVLTSKVPLRSAAGETIGVLGIYADITELKRVQESLEESRRAEQEFREKLTALHEVANELSTTGSLDELCRRAIELGRSKLGFDRLGLWFLTGEPMVVRGSFGTDEAGGLRDERHVSGSVEHDSLMGRALAGEMRLGCQDDADLHDDSGRVVGRGARAIAPLWDGRQVVGCIATDNLLTAEPITDSQHELLVLYASALGHLWTRQRTQQSLEESRQAERRFGESLTDLHEITNELSTAETFDELCRRAVELGHRAFAVEGMSLRFVMDKPDTLRGSFGTGPDGQVRDERSQEYPVTPKHRSYGVLRQSKPSMVLREVGGGRMRASASLWDGKRVIGILSATAGGPITDRQCELLTVYALALGHLCTRRRAQDALQQREQAERRFREKLTALHRVTNRLSLAGSFEDLCRRAVELGREELEFDRVSVWFLADEPGVVRGTFGTDEQGRTRDERECTNTFTPDGLMGRILADQTRVGVVDGADLIEPVGNRVVGRGMWGLASLWDGERIIGALSVDNLLTGAPISESQAELLSLYASALGHLCTLKRTEESLRQREQAERKFVQRLTTLHKATNELSTARSFDDLCLRAVELGREALGFTRVGLWFCTDEPYHVRGSYGTDWDGRTRDERDQEKRVPPGGTAEKILSGRLRVSVTEDDFYLNVAREAVGRGARLIAPLWDGEGVIGFIGADNRGEPRHVTEAQTELLILYAAALGALCSRTRAEDALRDSEERHRMLVEMMNEGLIQHDEDLKITFVNDRLCELMGRSRDDLIGRSALEPLDEAGRKTFLEQMDGRRRGERTRYEMDLLRKDGGSLAAIISPRPLFDENGAYRGSFSVVTDITARRQMEQRLRESEARYRALVENIPAITYVAALDEASTTLYISPQVGAFLGYSPEDYAADPDIWRKCLHPEDRTAVLEWVAGVQASGEASATEYRMIRRDGQMVWFRDEASVVRDDAGRPMVLQGVMYDVTERKQAEETLVIRNQAIHSSISAIALADLKGRLTYVNPSFLSLWGYRSDEEVLGRSSVAFWRAPRQARDVVKALRAAGSWTGEMTAKREDGTAFDVEASASMVTGEAGRPLCMMASFVDVTERKNAEEAMRMAQRKLTVAREDERRHVAGDLHDSVGQGLIALQMGVRSLAQAAGGASTDVSTRVTAMAGQCDALVREVRGICRGLYPPTLEALGLCSALNQLADDFRSQAQIRLNCGIPREIGRFAPEVEIAMFRVAQEAVTNAIRHGTADRVTVSLSYSNGRARLGVTDNGVGFDSQKAVGKGLGLSMMAERMQAVGGELKISSRPGRTRVAVAVPAELMLPPDGQP